MALADDIRNINYDQFDVYLWVVKQNGRNSSGALRYTARWVNIGDGLAATLKRVCAGQSQRIFETIPYALLAQNHEQSALHINADETESINIIPLISQELPNLQVQNSEQLHNIKFYIIKLVHREKIIYAFKKAEISWKAKKRRNLNTLMFNGTELEIDNSEKFEIRNDVDLITDGIDILILSKTNFETILSYKGALINDVSLLMKDNNFSGIFVDINILENHVGENKIQLRRLSAVKEKGYYSNQLFMQNLRNNITSLNFSFSFSESGQINITAGNCAEVITALLDHRLLSINSQNIYDVQNTQNVV